MGRTGAAGPCFERSVLDDAGLPLNDPAPDLVEITPDGKYFVMALRGPVPVSVPHGAQGSCPGVGIVEITEGTATSLFPATFSLFPVLLYVLVSQAICKFLYYD